MWPPYSELWRLACTTIAIAFQRMYASRRRSIVRSPGILLLLARRDRVDVRRVRLERQVRTGTAREVDQPFQQEMRPFGAVRLQHRIDRFEPFPGFFGIEIVKPGGFGHVGCAAADEAAYDRSLNFSGQGTSCGGIASRRARHSRRPAARRSSTQRTLQKHDAAIVVCARERAEAALAKLPSAALWQRLYREARSRGPVTLLSARITPERHPGRHRIRKKYSVGIRTADAGRTRLEGAGAARRARACCSQRTASRSDQSTAALEALLAAALAGDCADAGHEVERREARPHRLHSRCSTAARTLDAARTIAIDRGNHLARWLTALPPNVLNTQQLSARAARSRAQRGLAVQLLRRGSVASA